MEKGDRGRFCYPYGFRLDLFIIDCFWLVFVWFPCAVVMAAFGIVMVAFASGILYLMIRLFVWIVGKIIQHVV